MKRIFYLLLVVVTSLNAQPITQMPTYIGNPGDAWLPIVINNTNRKIASNVFFNSQMATKSTSDLTEGANQYFTVARARAAVSGIAGINFNPSTGAFSADFSYLDARYTTNLTLDPSLILINGALGVNKTKLARNAVVIPDADYTITAADETIALPQPSVVRTLNLPAASSMQGQTICIIVLAANSNAWVLAGSFVQTASTGSSPFIENFTNSGLASGQRLRLQSMNDGGTWRWFDTY